MPAVTWTEATGIADEGRGWLAYGTGSFFRLVQPYIPGTIIGLVDGDPTRVGGRLGKFTIQALDDIADQDIDRSVIAICSSAAAEIAAHLAQRRPDAKWIDLYDETARRALFEQALAARRDDPVPHFEIGSFYFGDPRQELRPIEELRQAIRHFEAAVQLTPAWGAAWFRLGQLSMIARDFQRAIEAFDSLLHYEPQNAEAHRQLSICHAHHGEVDAAARHLAQYSKLSKGVVAPEVARDLASVSGGVRRKRVARRKYPEAQDFLESAASVFRDDIASAFHVPQIQLDRTTKFFTMGSCFAVHLARHISDLGYEANSVPIGETVNSTFANRALMQWLSSETPGNVDDAIGSLLPEGTGRGALLDQIRTADVFVYTLGLAYAFFDRTNNQFVLGTSSVMNFRTMGERYEFRLTSVAENAENLVDILRTIRAINPNITVVMTVSPVPLQMSFEARSAVIADCLSKSTLRLAADQVARDPANRVAYFPSFEMVRWGGGHIGQVYGNDDGCSAHVAQGVVRMVVESFIERLQAKDDAAAGATAAS